MSQTQPPTKLDASIIVCTHNRAVLRALSARFSAPADEAFFREIIAWHFLGSMEGLFRSRRRT